MVDPTYNTNPDFLADQVDRLSYLHAEIARLEREATAIKETFKARGPGEIRGTTHKVVVKVAERHTLDTKEVRNYLTAEEIAVCTKTTTVVSVSVHGY